MQGYIKELTENGKDRAWLHDALKNSDEARQIRNRGIALDFLRQAVLLATVFVLLYYAYYAEAVRVRTWCKRLAPVGVFFIFAVDFSVLVALLLTVLLSAVYQGGDRLWHRRRRKVA